MSNISKKIDELAKINKQIAELKNRKDVIEAEITKQCEDDLANTKYKSIRYSGTDAELKAVNAESLKITYASFLPFIFNKTYSDAVKESTTYKLSASATRMIIGLWKGNYIKATVADVIEQMPVSADEKKQLLKKCKGTDYDKDVQSIRKFTELSEDDAKEYAYLINEAAVWQDFQNILKLNGIKTEDEINDILMKIKSAFVVEDSTKIVLSS
jgi:hypothetical protein